MYLNYMATQKTLILENIFSVKAWSAEHKKEIKEAIDKIKSERDKEIKQGMEAFKKNYKDDYEFIKFHKIPFLKIADSAQKFKEVFDKLKIDPQLKNYDAKKIYNYLSRKGPCTIFVEITEKGAEKKSKSKKEKNVVPIIVIPDKSFFEKIFLKGDMLGFFTHPLWIELEKETSIFHEAIEFNEYAQKRFHLGNFYIEYNGDFYKYGNHNSIFVLAKEAVVLNRFKNLEAIKILRDWRLKYEWRIIKAKAGIDFSKLTKLTPETIKKLEKIKPEIFGNTKGLFLKSSELKYYQIDKNSKNKINKKFTKNIDKTFKLPKGIKIKF